MADNSPSVWNMTGVKATPRANATKPSDIALTIRAATIVKNDKPTDGHLIQLTVAQVTSKGFSLQLNDSNHTARLTRIESPRGRQQSAGADSATVLAFLKGLAS